MPRAAYPKPQHIDGGRNVCFPPRYIYFLHPYYAYEHGPFLVLPAADGKGTLHHETARLACAAIAVNRTDGFLTEDLEGQRRVGTDTEAELSKHEYYFQVPGEDGLDKHWPMFPSFREWMPPQLPDYWKRCNIPTSPPHPMPRATATQVANRDISCRMTQHKEGTEIAHIIPASESDWYRSRGMSRHAEFNDASNALLFASLVHKTFDSKRFSIVPRLFDQESVLVAYVLGRNCPDEVIELYHDVQLQPLYGVNMDLLHARFVWNIFEYVPEFLKQDVKRWLRVRSENGELETRLCSPQECRAYATPGRSASPSKRSRTRTFEICPEDGLRKRKRSRSCASDCSISLLDAAESDHEPRGRVMTRRPSLTMTGSSDSSHLSSNEETPTEVAIWDLESKANEQHGEKDSLEEIPWNL